MSADDLDLLIHRWYERTLSSEEEARLWDRLEADPAAADRFVELGDVESGLVESLRAEAATPRNPSRRLAVVPKPRAASPVWPFVAAALFLGALYLGYQAPEPRPAGISRGPGIIEQPPAPPGEAPPARPIAAPEKPRVAETPPVVPVPRPAPPAPPPVNVPAVAPPVEPVKPPPVTLPAATAVAIVERMEGEAGTLRAGQGILAGGIVETKGAKSLVVLRMGDGTRLELRGDALLEVVSERSLSVRRGVVQANVVRRPAQASLGFVTPQAELTVLGTRLTISVAGESTRVEVEEGRVRCRRLPDGASVEVGAGHFAVAARGLPLVSKPLQLVRSFQDGVLPSPEYSGTRDAAINSASPGSNVGTAEQLLLQKSNDATGAALLRWDVTSIPPGSRVVSVELAFWLTGAASGPGYRVQELRRPWEESEATWRHSTAGRPWQVQGAQGEGDRGGRVLATLAPAPTGFVTLPLSEWGVALVQGWVNAPAVNHGLLIGGAALCNSWGLESRECGIPVRRPRLTVTWLPPAR